MNMTLLTLFNSRRDELARELDQAPTLDAAVALVRGVLDELQRRRMSDLTAPQARHLAELLGILCAAVGVLATARRTSVWSPAATPGSASVESGESDRPRAFLSGPWPRILQALICAGLFAVLYTVRERLDQAWAALILIPALVALEVCFLRVGRNARSNASDLKVIVQAESRSLLDAIADALDIIDRAIGDAGVSDSSNRANAAAAGDIDSATELLAVVQDMLGESLQGDADLTLRRSLELPAALARCGVQVSSFGDRRGNTQDDMALHELFDLEPNLDAAAVQPITLKPALLRNGKVLLRGRVIMPRSDTR